MKTRFQFLILIFILSLSGCKVKKIDYYALDTVPQEEGILFRQIPTEDQQICGPEVINHKGNLYWNTSSMINISSDGTSLVYAASSIPGQTTGDIYICSSQGGQSSIQRTFGISASEPVFSPGGKSICFISTFPGQEEANICLINTYEGNSIQYLTNFEHGRAKSPVFSTDGNRIFYSRGIPTTTFVKKKSYTNWNYSLWSVNRNTAINTKYVLGSSPDYDSQDRLLFTKLNTTTEQGEIWMLDLKTGLETLILRDDLIGFSTPKISPDGKRMLCVGATTGVKDSDSNLDIFMINLNGTGFKQLTFHPANDVSPCWSPDGNSVYFLSKRGNPDSYYHIWSFDIPK